MHLVQYPRYCTGYGSHVKHLKGDNDYNALIDLKKRKWSKLVIIEAKILQAQLPMFTFLVNVNTRNYGPDF